MSETIAIDRLSGQPYGLGEFERPWTREELLEALQEAGVDLERKSLDDYAPGFRTMALSSQNQAIEAIVTMQLIPLMSAEDINLAVKKGYIDPENTEGYLYRVLRRDGFDSVRPVPYQNRE